MKKVFLSFNDRDRNFVKLLESVLRFSGVDAWVSYSSINPGARFRDEISKALTEADVMIVVVTRSACESDWVRHEVGLFLSGRQNRRVIPVLMDNSNLNDIVVGLDKYQIVNFSEDYSSGFIELLKVFGNVFHYQDKRATLGSRRNRNRRDPAVITRRLCFGFWKEFESTTGRGKFDELRLSVSNQDKVLRSLEREIAKYRITDLQGKVLASQSILRQAVEQVWRERADCDHQGRLNKAINVIDTVADVIAAHYLVSSIDRRSPDNDDNKPSS